MINTARAASLAFCFAVPFPGVAQEVIGTITATIDGEARTWQTLQGSGAESYNTFIESFGGFSNISVSGYVEGGAFNRDVLQIVIGIMEGDTEPMETTVMFMPESMSRMWSSVEGEPIIQIDSFEAGQIAGRLSGELCFKDGMFAEPDPAQCQTIEGRFETALPVEG